MSFEIYIQLFQDPWFQFPSFTTPYWIGGCPNGVHTNINSYFFKIFLIWQNKSQTVFDFFYSKQPIKIPVSKVFEFTWLIWPPRQLPGLSFWNSLFFIVNRNCLWEWFPSANFQCKLVIFDSLKLLSDLMLNSKLQWNQH